MRCEGCHEAVLTIEQERLPVEVTEPSGLKHHKKLCEDCAIRVRESGAKVAGEKEKS